VRSISRAPSIARSTWTRSSASSADSGLRGHEVLRRPAVEVVLGHARLRELLEPVVLARRERAGERVAPDLLVASREVDFVELVAAAELAAHGVPQELHELHAVDGVDSVGAAQ